MMKSDSYLDYNRGKQSYILKEDQQDYSYVFQTVRILAERTAEEEAIVL